MINRYLGSFSNEYEVTELLFSFELFIYFVQRHTFYFVDKILGCG